MVNNDLTCHQVVMLLTFYVNGKTNYQVTNFIEAHLRKCASCRKKYEVMAKIINDFNEAKVKISEIKQPEFPQQSTQYPTDLKEKMSAYLDSELSDQDILRFKKFAISNLPIRGELENMYKVKNAINNSFEKTKSDLKEDFSKDIVVNLSMRKSIAVQEPILKIASIFIFILVFLSLGCIVMF